VPAPFLFSGEPTAVAALVVSASGLLAACVTDLRSRRIPNTLNLVLFFGLLALHLAQGGLGALASAGLSFLLCFGLGLVLYLVGALGAGDVKLLGAISVALEPALAWQLLARTALAGGILGVARLLADGNFKNALYGLLSSARRARAEGSSVPYGVAIAAGWLWLVTAHVGWTL
jgi:prepilin peptidase CpaA